MRLPDFALDWLEKRLWKVGARPPDFVIQTDGSPYIYRWHVGWHGPLFNLNLHYIMRSDSARCLHDHPWFNVSILLDGEYAEENPGGVFTLHQKGDVVFRGPWKPHRILLPPGGRPATSLFITGPRLWKWGFYTREGWKDSRDLLRGTAGGNDRALDKLCD